MQRKTLKYIHRKHQSTFGTLQNPEATESGYDHYNVYRLTGIGGRDTGL